MADTFYFNPGSAKPDISSLPPGLQGYLIQNQQSKYDKMMQLQDALSKIELSRQQEDFNQGAPVRAAERGANQSKFDLQSLVNRGASQTPGYADTLARGTMGQANQQQAAGRVALGTADSEIESKNAGNAATTAEARTKRQKAFLEHLDLQEPTFQDKAEVAPGITKGQQAYTKWRSALPAEAQGQFGEVYDPDQLKAIRDKLSASTGHRQKLGEIKATGDQQARVATIQGEYGVARAREMAKQKQKSYEQLLNEAMTTKNDQAALRVDAMIQADPDADPKLKARSSAMAAQARKNISVGALQRGTIDIGNIGAGPGAVANQIEQRLGATPPNVRAGQIHGMSELRTMYPGKPDQWIKDAYMRKYGVVPRD